MSMLQEHRQDWYCFKTRLVHQMNGKLIDFHI